MGANIEHKFHIDSVTARYIIRCVTKYTSLYRIIKSELRRCSSTLAVLAQSLEHQRQG